MIDPIFPQIFDIELIAFGTDPVRWASLIMVLVISSKLPNVSNKGLAIF